MGAIYRREMHAFFISGVAYVFLTVFFLLSGIFFYNGVITSGTSDTSPMFGSMLMIVLFLISNANKVVATCITGEVKGA